MINENHIVFLEGAAAKVALISRNIAVNFQKMVSWSMPNDTRINCNGKDTHAYKKAQLSNKDQGGNPVSSSTFCATHSSMCDEHGIAYETGGRNISICREAQSQL